MITDKRFEKVNEPENVTVIMDAGEAEAQRIEDLNNKQAEEALRGINMEADKMVKETAKDGPKKPEIDDAKFSLEESLFEDLPTEYILNEAAKKASDKKFDPQSRKNSVGYILNQPEYKDRINSAVSINDLKAVIRDVMNDERVKLDDNAKTSLNGILRNNNLAMILSSMATLLTADKVISTNNNNN